MGTATVRELSLSRREFLTVSGQAGLGALALMAGGGTLLPAHGASGAREIHLEAREIQWELAPGKVIKAMAYNGQIPGPELRLKGDRARVRFRNMSMEAHPMHLHGQSFKVLSVNGQHLPAPIVKDSVDVEAHMGSLLIEFTAHNPGDWFFHCHKPMHMEGGMITLARIG